MRMFERMLWKLSFCLRRNPWRYAFSDTVLAHFSPPLSYETDLLNRDWHGNVWDIGASIGKFTKVLAKANPNSTVFAFEPNMNSLYFLAFRTARLSNVTIVPCALTADGASISTSYDPNFNAAPTGPNAISLSIRNALEHCGGPPAFAKIDIEGAEYGLFEKGMTEFAQTTMLIEWHSGIPDPETFTNWTVEMLSDRHTLLSPQDAVQSIHNKTNLPKPNERLSK